MTRRWLMISAGWGCFSLSGCNFNLAERTPELVFYSLFLFFASLVYLAIGAVRRAKMSYWAVPIALAGLLGFFALLIFDADLGVAVACITLLAAAFRRARVWPWSAVIAASWMAGWIGGALAGPVVVVPLAVATFILIHLWLRIAKPRKWDGGGSWDSHGGNDSSSEFSGSGGGFGGGGASGGWGDGGGDGGGGD